MTALDRAALRARYDAQLRAWMPDRLPPGAVVERDGPVIRVAGLGERGYVTYVSVAALASAGGAVASGSTVASVSNDELDALIARQRDYFTVRGEGVEWKLHGHDEPADLADRLHAAGFEPEDEETVVVGLAAPLASASPELPEGVRLREVTSRVDFDQIAAMESTVWGADQSYRGAALEAEVTATPHGITIVVAETTARPSTVVSAGWVRYVDGTDFATLWGGSTLPQWRGRGIYKALVRYRAHLAVQRGLSLLQVDASADSRPILERNGFVAVTTTTPYVHRVQDPRDR
jgi:GNAT superfamily N-acetyltransferase